MRIKSRAKRRPGRAIAPNFYASSLAHVILCLGMDHFIFEGAGVGQFCLVKNFFFAFGLCKNVFLHQKVVHEFFFPLVFSLHVTKNEPFMRYANTSMEQKMIHVPQALLSLQAYTTCIYSIQCYMLGYKNK